jgi:hypothetical protein
VELETAKDEKMNRKNGGDIGEQVEKCNLGDECPFERALEQLKDEQHDRIKAEATLAVSVDDIITKVRNLQLEIEKFERLLRDFRHDFERHLRTHRYIDLAIISIGGAIGGFIAKLVVH